MMPADSTAPSSGPAPATARAIPSGVARSALIHPEISRAPPAGAAAPRPTPTTAWPASPSAAPIAAPMPREAPVSRILNRAPSPLDRDQAAVRIARRPDVLGRDFGGSAGHLDLVLGHEARPVDAQDGLIVLRGVEVEVRGAARPVKRGPREDLAP